MDIGYLVSWEVTTDRGAQTRTNVCTSKKALINFFNEVISGDGDVLLFNQFEGADFDAVTVIPVGLVDEEFVLEDMSDVAIEE